MIRNKLYKGIPLFMVLGLVLTPLTAVNAESYGTGITKQAVENDEIDPGFMIKPEVFVNGEEINSDEIKILNGTAALPLETIAFKMGDRLEGSNEFGYTLRKSDKFIRIIPSENKYIVNGEEDSCEFTVDGETTYAPYTFFEKVMSYNMNLVGNSILFGTNDSDVNSDVVLDGTAIDNMMISPEVYINGDKFPEFGLQIKDGDIYLPLEVVCEKLGDRLEGDITTAYYLRKENMMLTLNYSQGKYFINQEEHELSMLMSNGQVYVPASFFTEVLNYKTEFDGNCILFGTEPEKTQLRNTYENAKWTSENGKWYYSNGEAKVTGWAVYNNSWYFMNNEGEMQTGWIKDNDKWYFLNEDGTMATGWIKSNGQNYYLNKSGDMAYNTFVDGFSLAENGVCISLY